MVAPERDARRLILVNQTACVGCGACVAVCPAETLELVEGKARVAREETLACGHCAAVCPVAAITVASLDPAMTTYATFRADHRWLAPGQADLPGLVRLMASRRSCRHYRSDAVDPTWLADLVRIASTAPSGTNSQGWTFTVVPDRAGVMALGQVVANFFEALNRQANRGWLRLGLKLLGRPELADYHQRHAASVAKALRDYREHGRDRLFHGATAAILMGSRPGASCPAEDALLATQNCLLAAHAMGLGSCLIGYVVAAAARDPAIKRHLHIPLEEQVYSVIALGHPAVDYRRQTGRRVPVVRGLTL